MTQREAILNAQTIWVTVDAGMDDGQPLIYDRDLALDAVEHDPDGWTVVVMPYNEVELAPRFLYSDLAVVDVNEMR